MINQVNLIGRTTKDAEMRFTPNGKAVTKFTLAVDSGVPSKDGEKETNFINCTAWGKLGEICGEYVKKGMLLYVSGRLHIYSYEKDGNTVFSHEVVLNNMKMLEKKKS